MMLSCRRHYFSQFEKKLVVVVGNSVILYIHQNINYITHKNELQLHQ